MATSKSKAAEAYHSRYKTNKTWEENRKRRLERTLKAQPNNEQVKNALKGMVYRRKTPGPHGWSAAEIAVAKLFKQFVGFYDRAIAHSDPKVSQPPLSRPSKLNHVKEPQSNFKSFFSLEARLQGVR